MTWEQEEKNWNKEKKKSQVRVVKKKRKKEKGQDYEIIKTQTQQIKKWEFTYITIFTLERKRLGQMACQTN